MSIQVIDIIFPKQTIVKGGVTCVWANSACGANTAVPEHFATGSTTSVCNGGTQANCEAQTYNGYYSPDMTKIRYDNHFSITFTDMYNGVYTTQPIYLNGEFPGQFADYTPTAGTTAWKKTDQFKGGECCECKFKDTANPWIGCGTESSESACTTANKCWVPQDLDANRIRAALQALPNFAIPRVNVTNYRCTDAETSTNPTQTSGTCSAWAYAHCPDGDTDSPCTDANYETGKGHSFAVTFSHAANSGPQDTMTCSMASSDDNYAAVAPRMEMGGCAVEISSKACVFASSACAPATGDVLYTEGSSGDPYYQASTVCSQHSADAACTDQKYYYYESPASTTCTWTFTQHGCEWTASTSTCGVKSGDTPVTSTACSSQSSSGEKACHSTTYTIADNGSCGYDAKNKYISGHVCTGLTTQSACTTASTGTYKFVLADSACGEVKCNVRTSTRTETDGVTSVTASKAGTVCSSRGLCDETSGLCTCFDGYAGEACSLQTVFF